MAKKPYVSEDSLEASTKIVLHVRNTDKLPDDTLDAIGRDVLYVKGLRPSGYIVDHDVIRFEWDEDVPEDLGLVSKRIVETAIKHVKKAGRDIYDVAFSTKVIFDGDFHYDVYPEKPRWAR